MARNLNVFTGLKSNCFKMYSSVQTCWGQGECVSLKLMPFHWLIERASFAYMNQEM